ncbi:ABC transporter permease [Sinomicrobium weinanense]|uniref:ABC transporter permease n=1 Tax=Sinomicrobium weinanense TaxID=2842200 RepID=A0A926JT00_9FLAO|nr:ABC transporter permease [Sinomicrobium weinanense]MBC9796641.1 ABC transporter permease [Sinomicrobium weinanense]MBU3124890.1 ABC transporter permease [Sinomicrobium weinanense]
MRFIFERDTWQEIFGSIRKNKVRTVITVIGVLWGIFVYIALSGATKGLDNGFEREFQGIANNSMFVWTQQTSMPYEGFKIGRPVQLKLDDVEELRDKLPDIQFIAPRNVKGIFGGTPPQVSRGMKTGSYTAFADYPEIDKIFKKKIYEGGRFLNESDINKERRVCVIGERVRNDLFDRNEDPIGSYIKVDNVSFQVIGIYKKSENIDFEGDNSLMMPYTTYRKMFNTGDNVGLLAIAAYDEADIVALEKDVKRMLKRKHKVHPDDERAFGSFNLGEAFAKMFGFAKGLNFLSLFVGLATIIAGVIAIGNILLISVKERTRELGVRRALGATPGEVRGQILLESVFLTIVAGILGIILGAFVLAIINVMTQGSSGFPYTNPTVPIPYIFVALFVMVALGTLIGLIPAQRAVSIKPIDALREE